MNKFDWYFDQLVSEGDLDDAFDNVEQALWNIAGDQDFSGISSGIVAQEQTSPSWEIDITAPGTGNDKLGRRLFLDAAAEIDCSEDENGTSTSVGAGKERFISVFAEYDRELSNPQTDGNGVTVYATVTEKVNFRVVMGSEVTAPATDSDKPALDSEDILVADIKIDENTGSNGIQNADINPHNGTTIKNRREDFIRDEDANKAWSTTKEALAELIQLYSSGGGSIPVNITEDWHNAESLSSDNVEDAINEIINELADDTGDTACGADRIGADAETGSPDSLSQGSIRDQLEELLDIANARVRKDIADTITANHTLTNGIKSEGIIQLLTDDAFLKGADAGVGGEDNVVPLVKTATKSSATGIQWGDDYASIIDTFNCTWDQSGGKFKRETASFDSYAVMVTVQGIVLAYKSKQDADHATGWDKGIIGSGGWTNASTIANGPDGKVTEVGLSSGKWLAVNCKWDPTLFTGAGGWDMIDGSEDAYAIKTDVVGYVVYWKDHNRLDGGGSGNGVWKEDDVVFGTGTGSPEQQSWNGTWSWGGPASSRSEMLFSSSDGPEVQETPAGGVIVKRGQTVNLGSVTLWQSRALVAGEVAIIEAKIIGIQDDNSEAAAYWKVGSVYHNGTNLVWVYGSGDQEVVPEKESSGASGWDANISLSSPVIRIIAQGNTGDTVNWKAEIKVTIRRSNESCA